MPVSTLTSANAFVLQLASPASVQGGAVVLSAESLTGQTAASLASAASNASVEFVSAYLHDATAAGNDDVCWAIAPFAGTLTSVRAVAGFAPDANMVFTAAIGGVNVTGGAATIQSGDASGTVRSATPTAANSVSAGQAVRITHAPATNTVAGHVWFVLAFTRA